MKKVKERVFTLTGRTLEVEGKERNVVSGPPNCKSESFTENKPFCIKRNSKGSSYSDWPKIPLPSLSPPPCHFQCQLRNWNEGYNHNWPTVTFILSIILLLCLHTQCYFTPKLVQFQFPSTGMKVHEWRHFTFSLPKTQKRKFILGNSKQALEWKDGWVKYIRKTSSNKPKNHILKIK